MTLDPRSKFPGALNYVLKLHRDARPAQGHVAGRLENMSSGRRFDFCSGQQLVACLAQDARASRPVSR